MNSPSSEIAFKTFLDIYLSIYTHCNQVATSNKDVLKELLDRKESGLNIMGKLSARCIHWNLHGVAGLKHHKAV